MNNEIERLVVHETRECDAGVEIRRFTRVDIKYSNGDLFYSGWIQEFGDRRSGPTFFEENYEICSLERETVHRRDNYWQPVVLSRDMVNLRLASPSELNEIIDLNFQNYFDGGHNRISAYQGLNYVIDDDREMLVFTVDEAILGFLYIDCVSHTSVAEAYFDSLFVAPSVRDMGVGKALIGGGLEHAKAKGFNRVSGRIIGSVVHCQRVANLLYKKGFREVSASRYSQRWQEVDVLAIL